MMRTQCVFVGLLVWSLCTGCAAPAPPLGDADLLRAASTADGRDTINLMRVQEERVTHKKFVDGNIVQLLENGTETFAALTAAIETATRRIDMETYEFDSEEGGRFGEMLLARSRAGVEVNLIYDAWGAADTPAALFDRLRKGGVHVVEFNPLGPSARDGPGVADLNQRDHRKLLVVDGALAITGGVNITRVYRNKPGAATNDPDRLAWRDTDVRILGPAVAQFEALFKQTWRDQHGPPLGPTPATPGQRRGEASVQAVAGDPADDQPLIYRTLLSAISLAQHSIHLTTGFFVPTPDLSDALQAAAKRGVDVQIVVPAHSDSTLAITAGRAHYGDLLNAGVRIFERQGRVLHAKTAVLDGAWSAVGSSNLDWRSVVHNQEIDAVILDRPFGAQMEAMFGGDIAASRPIDPTQWARRPLAERLDEWGATLLDYML